MSNEIRKEYCDKCGNELVRQEDSTIVQTRTADVTLPKYYCEECKITSVVNKA